MRGTQIDGPLSTAVPFTRRGSTPTTTKGCPLSRSTEPSAPGLAAKSRLPELIAQYGGQFALRCPFIARAQQAAQGRRRAREW